MPARDERTKAATKVGEHQTAGRMNVIYRDAKGNSIGAVVLGAGSSSGLKIRLGSRMGLTATSIIDNVAAATGAKQTGKYFNRDRI